MCSGCSCEPDPYDPTITYTCNDGTCNAVAGPGGEYPTHDACVLAGCGAQPESDMPVGAVCIWCGVAPPADWLFCDGSPIPGGVASDLGQILGGANITPDLRGQFVRGCLDPTALFDMVGQPPGTAVLPYSVVNNLQYGACSDLQQSVTGLQFGAGTGASPQIGGGVICKTTVDGGVPMYGPCIYNGQEQQEEAKFEADLEANELQHSHKIDHKHGPFGKDNQGGDVGNGLSIHDTVIPKNYTQNYQSIGATGISYTEGIPLTQYDITEIVGVPGSAENPIGSGQYVQQQVWDGGHQHDDIGFASGPSSHQPMRRGHTHALFKTSGGSQFSGSGWATSDPRIWDNQTMPNQNPMFADGVNQSDWNSNYDGTKIGTGECATYNAGWAPDTNATHGGSLGGVKREYHAHFLNDTNTTAQNNNNDEQHWDADSGVHNTTSGGAEGDPFVSTSNFQGGVGVGVEIAPRNMTVNYIIRYQVTT